MVFHELVGRFCYRPSCRRFVSLIPSSLAIRSSVQRLPSCPPSLTSCSYLLHETVMWSPYHKQWFVLPRRMSKDAYDENADERMGANTIITASADFKSIQAITVGVSRGGCSLLCAC